MAMKRILTTSQREQLLSVDHLSEEDFKAYFSFSDYDLEVINQHRGKVNKLGFAIQLCLARYPGCSLSNWPIKSTRLTSYVSRQLHLDAIDLALKMYDSKEYSIRQILDASKLSKTTFYRYLNKRNA